MGLRDLFRKSKSSKTTKGQSGGDLLQDPLGGGLNDPLGETVTQNPLFGAKLPSTMTGGGQQAQPKAQKKGFFSTIKDKIGNAFTRKQKPIETMRDKHVANWHDNAQDVGKSAHEVRRVSYKNNIGDTNTREGFFKPYESKFHGSIAGEQAGIGKFDANDGDRVLEDPKLMARSLASTRLDQKLGLSLIAHEHQAKHGGQRGVVSSKVGDDERALAQLPDFDYANPEFQKGINRLQLFDHLSGQVDRHDNNIFVHPQTGKVTGIDNDMSWGNDNGILEKGRSDYHYGLPSHIDSEMAEKMQQMSEEDFLSVLDGRKGDYQTLGEGERNAARERFQKMKVWLSGGDENTPGARIVDEYNDSTYDEAVEGIRRKREDNSPVMYGFAAEKNKYLTGYLQRSITGRELGEAKKLKELQN